MDFKFDFDPAGFLGSLKKDLPSEPNYKTMTFEEYLKKNHVWHLYKDCLEDKNNKRLNVWRKDYEEEMKKRNAESEPEFLKNIHKIFEKKTEKDSEGDSEEYSDGEARRLAHISEFGS